MSLVKFGWLGKKVNWLRRYLIYGPRGDALLYVRRLNRMGARIDESLYMPAPELVFLDEVFDCLAHHWEDSFLVFRIKTFPERCLHLHVSFLVSCIELIEFLWDSRLLFHDFKIYGTFGRPL